MHSIGYGSCLLLPGGVDQCLNLRRDEASEIPSSKVSAKSQPEPERHGAAGAEGSCSEQQLARLDRQLAQLHEQMAAVASDYQRLAALQREIELITANKDQPESAWL
jgi:hypothetical protein